MFRFLPGRAGRLFAERPPTLLNEPMIRRRLNYRAKWRESHGAGKTYLGLGLLYYTLTYLYKARVAVCLGSGGGFVPRLMRQAQRDLRLKPSRTILVDGDMPETGWDSPNWLPLGLAHFFPAAYPDLEIRVQPTALAAEAFAAEGLRIDYLHIDADHSFEGCLADFEAYSPLLSPTALVSLHDTSKERARLIPRMGVPRVVDHIRGSGSWDVLDLHDNACGAAVLKRRN